jgi:hypothetical protein
MWKVEHWLPHASEGVGLGICGLKKANFQLGRIILRDLLYNIEHGHYS